MVLRVTESELFCSPCTSPYSLLIYVQTLGFGMLKFWIVFCCVSLGVVALHLPGHFPTLRASEITGFNWSLIEPHTHLIWHECHVSFQCARLQVPLDWNNSSNPNTVSLALIRVPAVVPYDDPTFGGTVLINPGGPGGSGVDQVMGDGYRIRDLILDSAEKHFEVLSWDPRGVYHTTPPVTCFETDWDREVWLYRNWAVGLLDSSEYALDAKWALYESFAKSCAQSTEGRFDDGTNMRQFVSTALNAQDMVAVIDALQNEYVFETKYLDAKEQTQSTLVDRFEPALLQYWGFSYGTFLGNTFASMFPHRIGRMVLDGNVDPQDYTRTSWTSNLFDNSKNLHWFYYACFHAGTRCALYTSNTSSLFDIESRVTNVLEQLYHNPVSVVHGGVADLVTHADLTELIHGGSYIPIYIWPEVARVIHDLSQRNGTSVAKYLRFLKSSQSSGSALPNKSDPINENEIQLFPPAYPGEFESGISVYCGDGDPINSLMKRDWRERISYLKNQSKIAGPFWVEIPFACQHWTPSLRPAERNRFRGPFRSELKDYDVRASPLLFIGNTADPVTPLRNAMGNSKLHEGSAVLTQDTPGHCTGPSNPSQCTFEVIRKFFANGTLPEPGKVCSGDRRPWD